MSWKMHQVIDFLLVSSVGCSLLFVDGEDVVGVKVEDSFKGLWKQNEVKFVANKIEIFTVLLTLFANCTKSWNFLWNSSNCCLISWFCCFTLSTCQKTIWLLSH